MVKDISLWLFLIFSIIVVLENAVIGAGSYTWDRGIWANVSWPLLVVDRIAETANMSSSSILPYGILILDGTFHGSVHIPQTAQDHVPPRRITYRHAGSRTVTQDHVMSRWITFRHAGLRNVSQVYVTSRRIMYRHAGSRSVTQVYVPSRRIT